VHSDSVKFKRQFQAHYFATASLQVSQLVLVGVDKGIAEFGLEDEKTDELVEVDVDADGFADASVSSFQFSFVGPRDIELEEDSFDRLVQSGSRSYGA
jgi:hypothetical protein